MDSALLKTFFSPVLVYFTIPFLDQLNVRIFFLFLKKITLRYFLVSSSLGTNLLVQHAVTNSLKIQFQNGSLLSGVLCRHNAASSLALGPFLKLE